MRYETVSGLQTENAGLRAELIRTNVSLRRVIVLLNKKHLAPSERRTLDLAMETAGISQESVNKIIKNELPWPA
jgi:hypothetical protein